MLIGTTSSAPSSSEQRADYVKFSLLLEPHHQPKVGQPMSSRVA
ncbi:hypothetical protein ACP70R_043900 [Stipagrostis hirtigluma subsp. patula]